MHYFDEEAAAIKILSLLKEKYPDRDWSVEEGESISFYLAGLLLDGSVFANEMVNYLLSLEDDQIRSFFWNKCYAEEFGVYDGLYKELLDELKRANKQFFIEYDKYLSGKKIFNQTKPIEADDLILRPTTLPDSEELRKIVASDDTPTTKGFDYSISGFNQQWRATFTIWNRLNQIVGFIALSDISGNIASVVTSNTYNLEYYICPAFRGRRYSEIAARSLLEAAFNGDILVIKEGQMYGKRYRFISITLEIKLVMSTIRMDNIPSCKTTKAIGFKDYGSIVTADENNHIVEFKNYVLINEKI